MGNVTTGNEILRITLLVPETKSSNVINEKNSVTIDFCFQRFRTNLPVGKQRKASHREYINLCLHVNVHGMRLFCLILSSLLKQGWVTETETEYPYYRYFSVILGNVTIGNEISKIPLMLPETKKYFFGKKVPES